VADNELVSGIHRVASNLGISPLDLGTVISYETGGTFDPWKAGPTTQWGQHRGLIQWGEPQRQKYGVTADTPVSEQLDAVGRYLKDAGVRPGHGIADVYSAINAGRVGRYDASDANNGGAPGTVLDKVRNQMDGHRAKAASLLGGEFTPSANSSGDGESRGARARSMTASLGLSDPSEAEGETFDLAKAIAFMSQPTSNPESAQRRAAFLDLVQQQLGVPTPDTGGGGDHGGADGGGAA
jgi:hypothetical protein